MPHGSRWTSFVADDPDGERPVRGLHEAANPKHRLRVEHDADTLLIHLSGEGGTGWMTTAVDRATRTAVVAREPTQQAASRSAYAGLRK